jgi:hypothetical protein
MYQSGYILNKNNGGASYEMSAHRYTSSAFAPIYLFRKPEDVREKYIGHAICASFFFFRNFPIKSERLTHELKTQDAQTNARRPSCEVPVVLVRF